MVVANGDWAVFSHVLSGGNIQFDSQGLRGMGHWVAGRVEGFPL